MLKQFVKPRVPAPLWFALRQLALELQIARLHRASSRKARALRAPADGFRLNLASGHQPKPGWINVDLFAPAADLRLDLRRPLPFPDDSVAYIYAEHFFEHLDYPNVVESMGWNLEGPGIVSEALQFLRECHRVLVPGGVLDLVVPDVEGTINEYMARHPGPQTEAFWGPAWCDTALHRVNYVFRQGREHKYAYDDETLQRLVRSVGFTDIRRRNFDAAIDAPTHELGSLCVISRK
jgi:predicted SAM-dependent methyltransferase